MAGSKSSKKLGKKVNELQQTSENIGARIKALRLQLGESSAELFAYKIGMDRKQYSNYERGADMRMTTFLRVCKALNVSPEEFFKGIKG